MRNNALAQEDPAVLLDVMQLGLTMAHLTKQTRYEGVVTTLRARDQLDQNVRAAHEAA